MSEQSPLCPQCLAQVRPDWPYCSHCGTRLNPSVPPPSVPPVCGNCGAPVDTSGAFCWKCGVPLTTGREPFIPAHTPAPQEEEPTGPSRSVKVVGTPGGYMAGLTRSPRRRAPSRKSAVSGTLALVGVAILIVSVLVGWYEISSTGSATESSGTVTVDGTAVFYPLNAYSVTITCSGSSQCFSNQTVTGPYTQGAFTSLGTLYDIVAGLVLASIVIGFVGALLVFLERGARYRWATALLVLAVLLALVAPVLLFAAQPTVLSSQSSPSSGPSPRTSFFGSCSGNACGEALPVGETATASWGPSFGWYFSLLSAVPLLVGLINLRSRSGRPPGFPRLEFSD